MLLVVDANIFFSALISRNATANLLFSDELELIAPEFLLMELEEHKKEILSKCSLSEHDFSEVLHLFEERVKFIPKEMFENFLVKANKWTPDPDDAEYLALALRFSCPLWSNDKELKKQLKIKVFSTSDLLKLPGL